MANARSRSGRRSGAGQRSRPPIRDHAVLLVKDLDDETLELIWTAKPSQRSIELNYLMEEEGPITVAGPLRLRPSDCH